MLRKISKIILLLLLVVLLFSGCSNSLSEMSVVQGVGVDKTQKGVKVSVQYLDLTKGSGTTENLGGNITSVALGTAGNISKAVSKTSANISSPVFFGQNKVIVFGNDYAQNGLENVVDYTLRAVDSRPDVFVALSKTTAEDVMKSSEHRTKVPVQEIYDMLKTGEETGLSCAVTVKDLQNHFLSETSDVYLPVLSTHNNKTSLDGIGIFSKGKYVQTLDETDTLGFLLVNDKVKTATVVLKDKKFGKVGVEVTNIRVKNTVYFDDGVKFRSRIKFDINLNDLERGVASKVTDADIKRIEKLAKKKIQKIALSAIHSCFEKKSDPFFAGKLLSLYSFDYYKKHIKTWRDELSEIDISVTAYPKFSLVNGNYTRK